LKIGSAPLLLPPLEIPCYLLIQIITHTLGDDDDNNNNIHRFSLEKIGADCHRNSLSLSRRFFSVRLKETQHVAGS
jgi:hypothetical protein